MGLTRGGLEKGVEKQPADKKGENMGEKESSAG